MYDVLCQAMLIELSCSGNRFIKSRMCASSLLVITEQPAKCIPWCASEWCKSSCAAGGNTSQCMSEWCLSPCAAGQGRQCVCQHGTLHRNVRHSVWQRSAHHGAQRRRAHHCVCEISAFHGAPQNGTRHGTSERCMSQCASERHTPLHVRTMCITVHIRFIARASAWCSSVSCMLWFAATTCVSQCMSEWCVSSCESGKQDSTSSSALKEVPRFSRKWLAITFTIRILESRSLSVHTANIPGRMAFDRDIQLPSLIWTLDMVFLIPSWVLTGRHRYKGRRRRWWRQKWWWLNELTRLVHEYNNLITYWWWWWQQHSNVDTPVL